MYSLIFRNEQKCQGGKPILADLKGCPLDTFRHALVPGSEGCIHRFLEKQEKIPEPTVKFFFVTIILGCQNDCPADTKDEGDLSLSPFLGGNVFRVAMLPEPDPSTRKMSWLFRIPRCRQ